MKKREVWNTNSKTLLSLIDEQINFGIKIVKFCIPLFMKKVYFGVNITKYQEIFRSVNFFENITFWVRSVNFFEYIIFWVRSVNFFVSSVVKSPSGGKDP